jgi:predicted NBD/HSP70 family sugar kinase
MKCGHFIGMDVHAPFCELAVVNAAGELIQRERCPTTIAVLRPTLAEIPRPRRLAGAAMKSRT